LDIFVGDVISMNASFEELTGAVDQLLRTLQYDRHTIAAYHRFWNRLSQFMEQERIPKFNRECWERYCYQTYDEPSKDRAKSDYRHCRRAITVLLEYQSSGTIYRRRSCKDHYFSQTFQPAIGEFMDFVSKTMTRTSHRQIRSRMESFLWFLERHGFTNFAKLNKDTILEYWKTRANVCRTTQTYDAYVLRKFFDFLYKHEYTIVDNSVFVPNVKGTHKGRIPSFYTTEEITTLLSNVDRESPIGKRDYAILLFAVRYGMRVGDIRDLCLSNIDWNKSSFTFCQGKTGTVMTFPLLDDVAAALIDYFKNGRPETSCRNIFVRHNAPYEAFGQDNNLHNIINKYMKLSGFTDFHHRKRGLHSLRHSIAGNMLNQGVPISTVSEVLGHRSSNTTMIYTKIGISQLRNCALEVD